MREPINIADLMSGARSDPFAYLGMHDEDGQLMVRALLPGARSVGVVDVKTGRVLVMLTARDDGSLFEAAVPRRRNRFAYRLRVDWGMRQQDIDDPYRFAPVLGELDIWLFSEGTHRRPYERLGAHPTECEDVAGVSFAVWAPNARRVSVVGSFNSWEGRRHLMRLRHDCGIWEIFIPALAAGELYKFEICGAQGLVVQKADPFALRAELRPHTASIVQPLPPMAPPDPVRAAANGHSAPVSIYEVHLASWRLHDENYGGDRHGGNGASRGGFDRPRWLSYRELAQQLIPYVVGLGFTHVELMPVSEYPYDGSWGYQPTGLYAPTARFGTPEDFRHFVEVAHAAGIGVLLDWVPGHFPVDAHGLAGFDGTHLYEHADPREGFHQDWSTLIYNYGRKEVCSFLVGNALYWTERFGVDGLRVDAVASMLYRDYSRAADQWVPNIHGGRENLEAIAFLRQTNLVLSAERPGAVTMAEESTSFPGVSRPVAEHGLGFQYKWNMGWMHDTLSYMQQDPVHRRHHHDLMTFGMVYAYSENFVLPLSHDEVVHGKGSLLSRMPGDTWQRFANLRAYFGFMWGHPGKKLLFMGGEFAQVAEWNASASLDWHLLEQPLHQGVQRLVGDLNAVYRDYPALHRLDTDPGGFEWIVHDDRENSVFAFLRKDGDGALVVVVSNFTPVVRHVHRIGVPMGGSYREIINTDHAIYGGSGVCNGIVQAQTEPWHGRAFSLALTLPPLATVMLAWEL